MRLPALLRSTAACLALASLLAGMLAGCGSEDKAARERGSQLFSGSQPLTGQIEGHTAALPPLASRCANCHTAGSAGPAASSSTASFGPLLGARDLTESRARRGGPPSRYDEASFCRLLHSGVDPAYIIIPRAMPRYEMPATDCHALWIYLSTAPG